MTIKKNWAMLIAFVIFFVLMGGYYDRMSVEMRTFILPLLIFAATALIYGRFRQLQYEVRSSRLTALEIVAQKMSLADIDGNERIAIAATSDNAVMTFYDDKQMARFSLELTNCEPALKLVGENGSAILTFDYRGMPTFTLLDETNEVIWSAP